MIKNIFSKIKTFVKNNKKWTALIVIILLVLAYFIFGNKKTTIIDTVTVERHNITEEVSATGNVEPLSNLVLSFESSGQVSHVYVSVGDKVYKGQILATLSNADLVASLEQAKAGLKITEANFSSVKNGSTLEQIAVNESQVEKAKSDLYGSKISLVNSIKDSYTKSDDMIRNYVDLMFLNPRSQNPSLLFQTDFQLQNDIISGRANIENILNSWVNSTSILNINSDFDLSVSASINNLTVIQTFLQNLALAINKLIPNSTISQTTITLWKTNISNARSAIDLSLSNLSSVSNQYKAFGSTLDIANSQLSLIKAGATAEQLKVQEATVEQAQANVDSAQARLNKSMIFSPINGVITNVSAKVGQTMQPGVSAISVISFGQYNVESFIPEADIAKIKIGNKSTTTLDAYGSNTFFDTFITKIDPAETVIQNVPTYKITLEFASSSDNRIKSGMTANLDILTGQKSDVLAVPSRSVYSIDTDKYVKLVDSKDNTKKIETKVETGMRGVDGYIEIISGLNEGDKIVASPNI